VLERDGETSLALSVDGGSGRLTLVVESLGRINYGPYTGEGKGIMRGVMIGRRLVNGWTHRLLPQTVPAVDAAGSGGKDGLAVAGFDVAEPLDAWLAFPGGGKGMVWLNGFLLGRYWSVGPQETLYAPAPLWRAGRNEIVVLDTDGLGATVEIREAPSFGETEEFIGS
jgi:beta-galactosidase